MLLEGADEGMDECGEDGGSGGVGGGRSEIRDLCLKGRSWVGMMRCNKYGIGTRLGFLAAGFCQRG